MNIVTITGRFVRNAILNGNGEAKAMKFTVAAPTGYDVKAKSERTEFVPCVFFNPSDKLRELLCNEGKGKLVEFQGNVMTSTFEKNGSTVWATEVRVNPGSFQFLPLGKEKKIEEVHVFEKLV